MTTCLGYFSKKFCHKFFNCDAMGDPILVFLQASQPEFDESGLTGKLCKNDLTVEVAMGTLAILHVT